MIDENSAGDETDSATDVSVDVQSEPTSKQTSSEPSEQPYWPGDWREKLAGTDEDFLKRLNRFSSPEGLSRWNRNLEKKLSSGEYKRSQPDGDTPEAIAEWRKANDVPEKPEDYLHAIPRDVEVSEADITALNRVFAEAHKHGVASKEMVGIVRTFYETQREALEQQQKQDADFRRESEQKLSEEWGIEKQQNLNAIQTVLDNFAPEGFRDRLFSARLADGRVLGDDPDAIRFMANIAREVLPDSFISPGAAPSFSGAMGKMDDEIAALETEMRTTRGGPPDSYWNNPRKQQRYMELIEKRERLGRRR